MKTTCTKMKYLKRILSSLWILLLLSGCKQSHELIDSKDTIVIDLTERYNDLSFKLEDISDDIKLIRLETNEKSQIKNFSGFVGKKHIISFGNKSVLQFSSNGNYIRTITKRGQGPEEFSQIEVWVVDANEQFLLYHDHSKNYITKYNLESGKFENSILFNEHGYLSKMLLINDSTLAILPSMFSDYGYLYFYQSTAGEIRGGIKKDAIKHPGSWAGKSPVFIPTIDNSILYHPSESDTIFKIKGLDKNPFITLRVEKPIKKGDSNKGLFVSLAYMDNERIFLRKTGYESIISPSSSSISTLDTEYLIYFKNNQTISRLKPFNYDYLGIELIDATIYFSQNNRFVLQYQAIEFQSLLNDAISKDNLPEAKRNILRRLSSEIKENDNPIIITGIGKGL